MAKSLLGTAISVLVFLVSWWLLLPAVGQVRGAAELSQAVARLPITGSLLHTAAHPDDERSALLAYMARGKRVRTAYLSATRGEGGQNLLGLEQYEAMGLLRTQELLAARRLDGAEQFFTRAFEFGFSKSAEETLAKWGRDAVLADFVRVIRTFRPDVIVAGFSGTPQDGHGHHQSSGILTVEAFRAAGDPTRFPEQLREGLRPWQAKKLYQSVSRFGPAENQPLPEGSVVIETGDYDPYLGVSYNQIGGEGRVLHRSQGFAGFNASPGPARNGFLLKDTTLPQGGAEKDLFDGVTITLDRYTELGAPRDAVQALKALVDEISSRFRAGEPAAIVPQLARGLELVRKMEAGADPELRFQLHHKERDFQRALELTHGQIVEAVAERGDVVAGESFRVTVTVWNRAPGAAFRALDVALAAPPGWKVDAGEFRATEVAYNRNARRAFTVTPPAGAPNSQPYWLAAPRHGDLFTVADPKLIGLPESPPLLETRVRWSAAGAEITSAAPVVHRFTDPIYGQRERRLQVVPAVAAWVEPKALIVPVGGARSGELKVRLRNNSGEAIQGSLSLQAPSGWTVTPVSQSYDLAAPGEESAFLFQVKAGGGARPGVVAVASPLNTGYQVVSYPHIPPQYWFQPAEAKLVPVDLKVKAGRKVGYIMGAGDEVPAALRQLGAAVTLLERDELLTGDLRKYDALVTGIRAYNVRPDLNAANHRILDYARQGGIVIVQYQQARGMLAARDSRLDFGPYPLAQGRERGSGAPRVTVEEAPVELLVPDHPLLSTPNRITAADFQGWIQERGLYFMSQWDAQYTPLLASNDPGEPPQKGGMLVTPLGKGLWVYTAYAWFRQLPAGVPGAYRIWANLLSWGGN